MDKPLIQDIKIRITENWQKKHLKSIEMNYRKAKCFDEVFPIIEKLFQRRWESLLDLDVEVIHVFAKYLGIDYEIRQALEYESAEFRAYYP